MSSGQKEWLTQIVNSSTSAIIVIDRQRRIKFANKAAAVIAGGGSSEGLIGRSYDEVLQEGEVLEFDGSPADPADFPSTHALREGRMTKGRIYERVHRGRHAWLQTDADPIPDEEGLPAFCILRFRDVSVDKWKSDRLDFLTRSERILSLTTDYHARLIEKARLTIPNLADWCTLNVVNPDGTLSRIAVAHRDPAKEELVRRLAELSERELGHDAGVGRVVKTGEPSFVPDVDPRSMKGNGRSQEMVSLIEQLEVCSSMTLPIISRDSVLGALSVAYAGSKRHYTERDLEFMSEFCLHLGVSVDNARLYEEIHARDKAKDDFLAALSHELRNPLAPIKSSLELLMLSSDLDRHGEELDLIKRQFDHLTNILNDLLDVTRYMRGKIRLEKQRFDLGDLLRDIARSYAPLASKRGIEFVERIPKERIEIQGDPLRLRQAIMNLLDNAQKFTPREGSIEISLWPSGETATVSVRDTGVGIPENELERVFDLHFQGTNKLSKQHTGLGIGLVLVKNIIDLHEGKVQAESAGKGTGSEFKITLPVSAEA